MPDRAKTIVSAHAGHLPPEHDALGVVRSMERAESGICQANGRSIHGWLRIADRHSEHVASADGEPVLSAGEISLELDDDEIEAVEVSDQSTGYCRDRHGWADVQLRSTATAGGDGGISHRLEIGPTNVIKTSIA